MPSWGGVVAELEAQGNNPNKFDILRRKYLVKASQLTGRATIIYATKWSLPDPDIPSNMLTIHEADIQGFMEVFHGVKEDKLDLVLHSPGGSVDAADAIVTYLRTKFAHIRAIIPNAAMSAAGMIACSCDRIVMGKHSFLGPADPQFTLPSPLGGIRQVAVQSILEQFNRAKKECMADQRALAVWAPLLGQYGPDLIVQAERASTLSESLVKEWLTKYMLKADPEGPKKAAAAANWLATHENFNSHGRHINREELRAKGLTVDSLEDNEQEQEIFLSLFHAATLTMTGTGTAKIIENHLGRAFINQIQRTIIQQPVSPSGPGPKMSPSGPAPKLAAPTQAPPFKKKY
jgi:hypothetical protein